MFDFLKAATGYIRPDEADTEEAGGQEGTAARYHGRVVRVACACGVVFAVAAPIGLLMESRGLRPGELTMVLTSPLMGGIGGLIFGVAAACLLAPHEFLTGPVGRKWMTLIGTKSVVVARLVCAIIVLMVAGGTTALVVKSLLAR